MSSLFLFGAGASYGSGPCTPRPPPLGGQLFAALRAADGVAASVNQALAEVFVSDFEAGMDRFWLEHNTLTTKLLRDMARFFAPFEPLDGNHYIELLQVLGGTRKKAVMVTTNYDLLIEHAIARLGLLVTYGGLPVGSNNVPLLKIHGSCNFLPNIAPQQITGIGFDLSHAPGGSVLDAGVRVAQDAQEILEFCDSEDSIAPALAMYSPSKQVLYCRTFVQNQQQAWLASLEQASRIYVIGLRVHLVDEHIWLPLAQATGPLYYVGRKPKEFISWSQSNRHGASYLLAQSFAEAIPRIAAHHGYRGKSKGHSRLARRMG